MRTSCYNGVGGVVSNCHVAVAITVVGTCVIVGVGFKGQYLDCAQLPRPSTEAQNLPRLCLSCVCFVVIWWLFL